MKHVEKDVTIIGNRANRHKRGVNNLAGAAEYNAAPPPCGNRLFGIGRDLCLHAVEIHEGLLPESRPLAAAKLRWCLLQFFSYSRWFNVFDHLSRLDLGSNKLRQIGYGIPMGALGVILTIMVGARLAAFSCVLTSIYMGIIIGDEMGLGALPYILVAVFTSYGAIYTAARIRQRSDLYRAGGVVMILASFLILALSLQQYKTFEELLIQTKVLKWSLLWGAVKRWFGLDSIHRPSPYF